MEDLGRDLCKVRKDMEPLLPALHGDGIKAVAPLDVCVISSTCVAGKEKVKWQPLYGVGGGGIA